MQKSEFAPAKINLTLEVLGRRSDGYHEIRSLVAFTDDIGDRLALAPPPSALTEVVGPFATQLAGGNLVDRAVAAISKALPGLALKHFTLEKNLPVASGIGGGSADAAAALRLLSDTYPAVSGLDIVAIAQTLGADVPVCLRRRAALMTGVGERIEAIAWPDAVFAVLANPLVSVPEHKTAQVFALLEARPMTKDAPTEQLPKFSSASDVFAYAAARENALETPARKLFPVLDTLLAELGRLADCRLARLSGAGPTCFALFGSEGAAANGAAKLNSRNPNWWIRSTRLA
jgi:4-diphosphocytidyl-2-C-methyl-D-erythritol kinase